MPTEEEREFMEGYAKMKETIDWVANEILYGDCHIDLYNELIQGITRKVQDD